MTIQYHTYGSTWISFSIWRASGSTWVCLSSGWSWSWLTWLPWWWWCESSGWCVSLFRWWCESCDLEWLSFDNGEGPWWWRPSAYELIDRMWNIEVWSMNVTSRVFELTEFAFYYDKWSIYPAWYCSCSEE